jgi:hypothetical protein
MKGGGFGGKERKIVGREIVENAEKEEEILERQINSRKN